MTREEEIERASVHHLYQYDYSYEEGEHLDFYIKGFTEGAKWADKNPINVWHDASEEPHENGWILLQFSTDVYDTLKLPRDVGVWLDFVKMRNFVRWAYISDLLPKGGEK